MVKRRRKTADAEGKPTRHGAGAKKQKQDAEEEEEEAKEEAKEEEVDTKDDEEEEEEAIVFDLLVEEDFLQQRRLQRQQAKEKLEAEAKQEDNQEDKQDEDKQEEEAKVEVKEAEKQEGEDGEGKEDAKQNGEHREHDADDEEEEEEEEEGREILFLKLNQDLVNALQARPEVHLAMNDSNQYSLRIGDQVHNLNGFIEAKDLCEVYERSSNATSQGAQTLRRIGGVSRKLIVHRTLSVQEKQRVGQMSKELQTEFRSRTSTMYDQNSKEQKSSTLAPTTSKPSVTKHLQLFPTSTVYTVAPRSVLPVAKPKKPPSSASASRAKSQASKAATKATDSATPSPAPTRTPTPRASPAAVASIVLPGISNYVEYTSVRADFQKKYALYSQLDEKLEEFKTKSADSGSDEVRELLTKYNHLHIELQGMKERIKHFVSNWKRPPPES